jgi:hypothetical protein
LAWSESYVFSTFFKVWNCLKEISLISFIIQLWTFKPAFWWTLHHSIEIDKSSSMLKLRWDWWKEFYLKTSCRFFF